MGMSRNRRTSDNAENLNIKALSQPDVEVGVNIK